MALKDFFLALTSPGTSKTNAQRNETQASKLGLLAGAQVAQLQDTSLTLSDDHHGLILDFLASSAITVTIPAGLRDDFFCGVSQGGTSQVTIQAGAGASVVEQNSLSKTAQRYALVSVICFHANAYRLFGSLG